MDLLHYWQSLFQEGALGYFFFEALSSYLWWAFLSFAGLPPTVLDPSVLSKRVETSPTGTLIDPACAQTMPRLPGACLR